MSEIKFKVSKDGNEKKYIPLIRKMLRVIMAILIYAAWKT